MPDSKSYTESRTVAQAIEAETAFMTDAMTAIYDLGGMAAVVKATDAARRMMADQRRGTPGLFEWVL